MGDFNAIAAGAGQGASQGIRNVQGIAAIGSDLAQEQLAIRKQDLAERIGNQEIRKGEFALEALEREKKQREAYSPVPDVISSDPELFSLTEKTLGEAGYKIKDVDGKKFATNEALKYGQETLMKNHDLQARIASIQVGKASAGLEKAKFDYNTLAKKEAEKPGTVDPVRLAEAKKAMDDAQGNVTKLLSLTDSIEESRQTAQIRTWMNKNQAYIEEHPEIAAKLDSAASAPEILKIIQAEDANASKFMLEIYKQRGLDKRNTETIQGRHEDARIRAAATAAGGGSVTVNSNTGAYFDKKERQWYMPGVNGERTKITAEQARQLGLQTKEETVTNDIKVMQQSAPSVIDFADKSTKQIKEAQKGLGPMGSRWKELKQGKVGLSDPAFSALKTNLGLLETRLMKMHVGARGGEYIMQHFKDMLDITKQSPENILANLKEIRDYADEVKGSKSPKLYLDAVGSAEGKIDLPQGVTRDKAFKTLKAANPSASDAEIKTYINNTYK